MMENKSPNPSIECSVKQCEYHCGNENYCTLNKIRVATHEANPTVCECVDCESFVKKTDCAGGSCH